MTPKELYELLDKATVKFKVVEIFEGLRILSFEVEEIEDSPSDNTYDEYGVNTKNSFNTPPKGESK